MTSGADIAIAIGTIATAVLALIGLAVSLHINKQDRDQAVQVAKEDRAAAMALAAADRAAAREDAERRHIVDLLLELDRQVARVAAYSNMPQGAEAAHQIRSLLLALPPECAYSIRKQFGQIREARVPGAVDIKLQHLDLGSVLHLDPAQMGREIAYDIDRYMTSGLAPGDVWNDASKRSRRGNVIIGRDRPTAGEVVVAVTGKDASRFVTAAAVVRSGHARAGRTSPRTPGTRTSGARAPATSRCTAGIRRSPREARAGGRQGSASARRPRRPPSRDRWR